jgi:YD repeat-containing protein
VNQKKICFIKRLTNINTKKNTTFVQKWEYQYDNMGNISIRKDFISDQEEMFGYDNLNRLLSVDYEETTRTLDMEYDELGNITSKSDFGDFAYEHATKPNAVTEITNTDEPYFLEHEISYFVNGRTKSIEDTDLQKLEFIYGPNNQRRKAEYSIDEELQTTTYYAFGGSYEEITDENEETTKYYYIGSPDGLVAMRKVTSSTNDLYYVLTDHLGSICEITDDEGDLVLFFKMHFKLFTIIFLFFNEFIISLRSVVNCKCFAHCKYLNINVLKNLQFKIYNLEFTIKKYNFAK